ncbi:MAG: putative membrane protein [Bacillariaceae sp.]|jgi:uncharacterized membrane protein
MVQASLFKNGPKRNVDAVAFAVFISLLSGNSDSINNNVSAFTPTPAIKYNNIGNKNSRVLSFVSQRQRQHQPYIISNKKNIISCRPISFSNNGNTFLASSPSGIDQLPELVQAGVFVTYYITLIITTIPTVKLLDIISSSKVIGLERWRDWFIDTSLPLLIGILFLTAGTGHFIQKESFMSIYPPPGTWGFWYLPGSANFHVTWTGIVEILGGSGLLLSVITTQLLGMEEKLEEKEQEGEMISLSLKLLKPLSALMLFLLTLLVTPANIYMYTHGATMGDAVLDVSFHYIRFGFQVMFLSLLFVLAKDSLFFVWGDELD